MKFSTYLLLVGSAAAQCSSQEKVDTSAALALKQTAYAAAIALKTPDILTFETELKEAQDHVNDMIAAKKIAGTEQVNITQAESNLTSAKAALDTLLTATGNPAKNKVLIDIQTALTEKMASQDAYDMAINKCVPAEVEAWHTTKLAEQKIEDKYAEMSAEDKAAWDKKKADRLAKMHADDAEMKNAAKYHEMPQEEQDMYNKMLIAQKTLRAEQMKEQMTKMDMDGKTKEQWDAMTPEQQAAAKERMSMMREKLQNRKDQDNKDDDSMRNFAGYFGMNQDGKNKFDSKLGDLNTKRQQDDNDFMDKLKAMKTKAGWDTMTDAQKKAFMEDVLSDRKDQMDRNGMFDKQDMMQKSKMGYFDKMSDSERANFDTLNQKDQKDRKDVFDKLDSKVRDFKDQAGFKGMSKDDQGSFMSGFKDMMSGNFKDMMKDRSDDDDMRKNMSYFSQSKNGRDSIDSQIKSKQDMRGQSRMTPGQGQSGSSCTPMTHGGRGGMSGGPSQGGPGGQSGPGGMSGGPGGMSGKSRRLLQQGGQSGSGGMISNLMSMFGGKDGMSQMMGNFGPSQRQQSGQGGPGGSQGGPGGSQGGPGGMQGGKGGPGGQMGGSMCSQGMCCGHTLNNGTWGTTYLCNDENAALLNGFRFKCAEGAKHIAAGALSLMAAAYMMA